MEESEEGEVTIHEENSTGVELGLNQIEQEDARDAVIGGIEEGEFKKNSNGVKLGLNRIDAEDTCDAVIAGIEEGELNENENEIDMDLVDSPIRAVNIQVYEENVEDCSFSRDLIHSNVDARGIKRARVTYEIDQASVHVSFNSLTRASKQKLQELLQQWSEWHSQENSSSQDCSEVLESGEETYFPALRIGLDKPSSVSFWVENQTRQEQDEGFLPLDENSVPLYDRGFALGLTSEDGPGNAEGGLEIVNDASRCFNCGSYSHSLRECPKPRDNVAVNNARKQHNAKKNQSIGSQRYYQNSSGGKYDGLKPGALDAETRKLLGIGELEPPPWLNRMRELGYPPGYLDIDDNDEPSGITIFADGDVNKEQQEDGEIFEMENSEPQRKQTVEFPGINAPIPENADETLWAAGPSSSELFGSRSRRKVHRSSEDNSIRYNHERRLSREYMNEGPPGVDPPFSPTSYPPRYGYHDSVQRFESPRYSPYTLSRSHSDRGRSELVYEDFVSHNSYSSSSYSSWSKRSSPHHYGSQYGNDTDERRGDCDRPYHRSRW